MAEDTVIAAVKRYLAALPSEGIHPHRAVLFGSCARNAEHEYSDIDVVVIAPEFDKPREIGLIHALWRATLLADNRIEPIRCGEREWETDEGRPILEIARREGIVVTV